jgi:hypothetical protein
MPRFFDWEALGDLERDRRGIRLADLEAAIEVATDCACDLVADDIQRGASVSSGIILVTDSNGQTRHKITLSEARALLELTTRKPN